MKSIRLTFLLMILQLLGGCFNTELVAPENMSVKVLPAKTPAIFHEEYRNWYILWGAVPIYATQPEELIRENHLTEARVQTVDTFEDGIISYFTSELTIFPQTVIVEGNPEKKSTSIKGAQNAY